MGDDVIRQRHVESEVKVAAILDWWPSWNGGHDGTAAKLVGAILEWRPSWISCHVYGVHLGEVTILDWWPS